MIGEQITVSGDLIVSDTYLQNNFITMYKFTDIYGQDYWSEKIK